MPERSPDDWSGGGGEIAGFHQPGFIGSATGVDAELARLTEDEGATIANP